MPAPVFVESTSQFRVQRGSLLVLGRGGSAGNADIFAGQDTYGWPPEQLVWAPPQNIHYSLSVNADVFIPLPNLVGQTSVQAIVTLFALGLNSIVVQGTASAYPAGSVMAQSPLAGSLVYLGTYITLSLSLGPQNPPFVEVLTPGTYKGVPRQPGDEFYLT